MVIPGDHVSVSLLSPADPAWAGWLASRPHDVHHLPAYASLMARLEDAEAVALLAEGADASLLIPLLIRPIPGHPERDATSPYGYPGPLQDGGDAHFAEAAIRAIAARLTEMGLVSLFIRSHPLVGVPAPLRLPARLTRSQTVAIDLNKDPDVLAAETRRNHRTQIQHALDAGLRFRMAADLADLAVFEGLYLDTMARVGAEAFYRFGRDYFQGLREALGSRLRLGLVEHGRSTLAAGLVTSSCGIAQMHLVGSSRAGHPGAVKLLFQGVRDWARETGHRWLHLGGGRGGADDSLLHFKAGFSRTRCEFYALGMILRADAYASLMAMAREAGRPPTLAFPEYR